MLQKLPIRMVNQDDPKDNALHNRMVELVERMLTLHKRLADVRIPHNQTVIQQHAIGQEALKQHSAALLVLADAVRYGPGFTVFIVGLLLLAVGAILIAIAIWQSGTLSRWSGIPFALGFVLYLHSFSGPNQSEWLTGCWLSLDASGSHLVWVRVQSRGNSAGV